MRLRTRRAHGSSDNGIYTLRLWAAIILSIVSVILHLILGAAARGREPAVA